MKMPPANQTPDEGGTILQRQQSRHGVHTNAERAGARQYATHPGDSADRDDSYEDRNAPKSANAPLLATGAFKPQERKREAKTQTQSMARKAM
jgi:hypothetical protein